MTRHPKTARPYMPGYGVLPADQGSGLRPWSYAVERLKAARSYWIATTRPDGKPHAVPIWAVWVEDRLMFSTGAQSRKARNLLASPYVVIGAEPGDDAIVIEGEATLVAADDLAVLSAFAAAYGPKYGENMDDFNEPIYQVRPKLAFAFGTADFVGGATRWKFD